jgi:hypothetical protein
MHHTFDETPDQVNMDGLFTPISQISHAPFNTHLGMVTDRTHEKYATTNLTGYRHRGYKLGSTYTAPDEQDAYWKQPGHSLSPLAKKGGRFNVCGYLMLSCFYDFLPSAFVEYDRL